MGKLPEEQRALDRINTSSICLRHTVIQFKILHHLQWSKVSLARFIPSIDPICVRCKQTPATLSHMFWCSKLKNFWHAILKTSSDVLQISIEYSSVMVIFRVITQDTHYNQHPKNIIAIASLIARQLILLRWKDVHHICCCVLL